MYKKSLNLLFLLIAVFGTINISAAQSKKELWVMQDIPEWNIAHTVTAGETIFTIARRYHVPPALLADANALQISSEVTPNDVIIVPVNRYNLLTEAPESDAYPLYYKAQSGDNIGKLSRRAYVTKATFAAWNNLSEDAVLSPGQQLHIGWIKYDATPVIMRRTPPVTQPVPPLVQVIDTATEAVTTTPTTPVPSLEQQYLSETDNGQTVITEKGAAAFYQLTTNAKGVASLAFHNSARKGSIIKVKNTNNGRYVYVKVIGPVPTTKQYHNCIIGLSDKVQHVLGVRETKAFCELTYGSY